MTDNSDFLALMEQKHRQMIENDTGGKYSYIKQNDFQDPVVRCDSCQALVHRRHVHKMGCCPECGNRRFRNVLTLKEGEMAKLKVEGIDPEFIALFEGVELD